MPWSPALGQAGNCPLLHSDCLFWRSHCHCWYFRWACVRKGQRWELFNETALELKSTRLSKLSLCSRCASPSGNLSGLGTDPWWSPHPAWPPAQALVLWRLCDPRAGQCWTCEPPELGSPPCLGTDKPLKSQAHPWLLWLPSSLVSWFEKTGIC